MGNVTAEEMAGKLRADRFRSTSPTAATASDPIADTPMVVTLDELRPYEHNPRVTRNPLYDEIKASIRERGLDAPPAITRRPGEPYYIIRNGGNTRLAILRELWSETKAERFFRIPCLFRPWSARGEIIALTGHLAENELHGGLSFIERALAVEKARELYEQESGAPLSQSELSRRLTADGYPVAQPHISRMQDAVQYLLPAIPTVLYAGLGRPLVERLAALRRAAARLWETRAAGTSAAADFLALFQEVLAPFDIAPRDFSIERVQDELIGQMAELLHADYDALTLEMDDTQRRQRVLGSEPTPPTASANRALTLPESVLPPSDRAPLLPTAKTAVASPPVSPPKAGRPGISTIDLHAAQSGADDDRGRQSVATLRASANEPSPRHPTTDPPERAQPDRAPAAAVDPATRTGGLSSAFDGWHIEPDLDAPADLRVQVAQLARAIAAEVGQADRIQCVEDGVGFYCHIPPDAAMAPMPSSVVTLLHALSVGYSSSASGSSGLDLPHFADDLAPLLLGHRPGTTGGQPRLTDDGLITLFRLLRLARRLLELEHPREDLSKPASAS